MKSDECRVESKKPSKWRSTKWWVTVWAMCLTTFIIITGKSEFASVLMMLAGVPVAYIGANVVQKKIYSGKDKGELFDTLFPSNGKGEWSADALKEMQ